MKIDNTPVIAVTSSLNPPSRGLQDDTEVTPPVTPGDDRNLCVPDRQNSAEPSEENLDVEPEETFRT